MVSLTLFHEVSGIEKPHVKLGLELGPVLMDNLVK
jgi:hypothetical protein